MDLRFTQEGAIKCNTYRSKSLQARNMISDGCYGNYSGGWNNAQESVSPAGYKSYRALKVTNANMTYQSIPDLVVGHKYYFACRYKSDAGNNATIVLRTNSSDLNETKIYNGNTNGNWVLGSTIFSYSDAKSNCDVCIYVGGSGTIYCSHFILIDLTTTFGSGVSATANSIAGNSFSGWKFQRYKGDTFFDQPYGEVEEAYNKLITFNKDSKDITKIRIGFNGSVQDCTESFDVSTWPVGKYEFKLILSDYSPNSSADPNIVPSGEFVFYPVKAYTPDLPSIRVSLDNISPHYRVNTYCTPTKEWCDNNIREHEVIVNYGSMSPAITPDNYNSNSEYGPSGWTNFYKYNYLSLNGKSYPREYMWWGIPNSDHWEVYIYCNTNLSLNSNNLYYFQIEACTTMKNNNGDYTDFGGRTRESFDFYFPIAEPLLQQIPWAPEDDFTSRYSGSMKGWKRVSMYGGRSQFTSDTYVQRFDFNNSNYSNDVYFTALALVSPYDNIGQYNLYNGTSISINDINKEWCDRWIDARSSPIIHIKDWRDTSIVISPPLRKVYAELKQATSDTFNSWVNLKPDTWHKYDSSPEYNEGELIYFDGIATDLNTPIRFVTQYLYDADRETIVGNNLGWGEEGSYWWNLCDGYNIQCNDIEIRPELNDVIFDKTGTVKCKQLIKNTGY